MSTASAAVKLLIFAVVSVLLGALVAVAIAGTRFSDTVSYRALFDDASGLTPGQNVRISGVVVGTVSEVRVVDRDQALVTFSVQESWPLTTGTLAKIRYKNLVGDRYLELAQGKGLNEQLEPGGLIPNPQTEPALDLTVLLNGFKPLFQALSPKQTNRLANSIIQVLQGQAGTVESLLASTASLTNTLANREAVIDDVIDNLNEVLATLDERDRRLSKLIAQLQQFVSGLAADRDAIGESLERINELTDVTANLLADARPALRADIRELRALSENLARNKDLLRNTLDRLPSKVREINRTASYGSWFNFYLCTFNADVVLPTGKVDSPEVHNQTARCNP